MYCENCGVELEPTVDRCPLCDGRDVTSVPSAVPEYASMSFADGESAVRRVLFRLVTLLIGTAAAVVLVTDMAVGDGLRWSPVVTLSLGAAWVVLVGPTTSVRIGTAFVLDVAAVVGLLYGIALLYGGTDTWFIELALPIIAVLAAVVLLLVVFLRRFRGLVRVAVVLAAAGILSTGIDLVIRGYRGMTVQPGWSVVVLVSVFPVALFLYLLQATVLRYIDLRRRFHL